MTDGTRSFAPSHGGWAAAPWYLAIAGLIFAATIFGKELTQGTDRISTVWIANGVLLCFVLVAMTAKRPRRALLAILAAGAAGNIVADVLMGDTLPTALALSLANTVEIGVCAAILAKTGLAIDFTRPRFLLVFCVVALAAAPIVSGVIASGYFAVAQGESFIDVFTVWYAADALGLIIVTPSLMVLRGEELRGLRHASELTKLAGGIAIVGATLFIVFGQSEFPLLFLVFPAILVATFWSGFTGASLVVLLTAIVAGVATFNGSGPIQLI